MNTEVIRRKTMKRFSIALFAILFCASVAQATTITYYLVTEFSGGTPPAGMMPPAWLTATFTDSAAGEVTLTMTATNLVGNEKVTEWSFNFDPQADPTKLTPALIDGTAPTPDNIRLGINVDKADGDGYFDIKFEFPTSGDTFGSLESISYKFTYSGTGTLSADWFDYPSEIIGGGNSIWHTAAHVQATGADGKGSGWIGDGPEPGPGPEPAALLLVGSGLLLIGFLRKRMR